ADAPPGERAGEHAGALAAHAVPDRLHRREIHFGIADEPRARALDLRTRERGVLAVELDRARERREAVAEAPVDRALGREERGARLPAPVRLVEVRAHHAREDPAAAVRREDSDHRETAGLHGDTARDRHAERERSGGSDDRAVVPRADAEIELGHAA